MGILQLKVISAQNRSIAVQKMGSVVKALLIKKNVSVNACFYFLDCLSQNSGPNSIFFFETLFPVWMYVLLSKPDSEGDLIYKKLYLIDMLTSTLYWFG